MMKKNALWVMIWISNVIYAAQQAVIEWDPQLYENGNRPQYTAALSFLEKNNISLVGKNILDIGCGTGGITAYMAKKAHQIDGFDASHNMVQWANKHHTFQNNNISFTQGT